MPSIIPHRRSLLSPLKSLFGRALGYDRVARSLDGLHSQGARVEGQLACLPELQNTAAKIEASVNLQGQSFRDAIDHRSVETRSHLGLEAKSIRDSVAAQSDETRSHLAMEAKSIRDAFAGQSDETRALLVAGIGHLDVWKFRELEGLLRFQRRKQYFEDIAAGRLAVPHLETAHPIAVESNDTKHPRGAKNDNSIALRFNQKLYRLFGNRSSLSVLDIGCAGGGLVRSLIDDGHFAVGLDGSDFGVINQTAEWSTIPRHLFTCDATMPFTLTDSATKSPLRFDAITAWELMEHITDAQLPGLFSNIDRHLAPGGAVLCSVATFLDHDPVTGVVWHVTVKPRPWWIERFRQLGFTAVPTAPFGPHDWLRGSGLCRYDWTEEENMGFHVLLRRNAEVG